MSQPIDLMALSVKDFKYIAILSQTRHFGQAAKICQVTQPTLSAQIKKVEDVLGVKIFERTNRNVHVTCIGEAIVKQVKVLLNEVATINDIIKKSEGVLSGLFRLGIIHTLGPYFVPLFIESIKSLYPKLNLELTEGFTEDLIDSLNNRDLDAVLASETFDTTPFATFSVFFEPMILLVSKHNALAQKDEINIDDINANEMILMTSGHCLRDDIIQSCKFYNLNENKGAATSIETMRYLVASNNSYAIIPKLSSITNTSLNNVLVNKNFSDKKIGRKIILVCRKSYPNSQNILELKKFFKRIADKNNI